MKFSLLPCMLHDLPILFTFSSSLLSTLISYYLVESVLIKQFSPMFCYFLPQRFRYSHQHSVLRHSQSRTCEIFNIRIPAILSFRGFTLATGEHCNVILKQGMAISIQIVTCSPFMVIFPSFIASKHYNIWN
jgi:hypothetical protein